MEKIYTSEIFNIPTAKRIQSGEVRGRIRTRGGQMARIVDFDLNENGYPLLVISGTYKGDEIYYSCDENGCVLTGEFSDDDIVLELITVIPDRIFLKKGDIVTCGWENEHTKESCKWISLVGHGYGSCGQPVFDSLVSVCIQEETSEKNRFDVSFDDYCVDRAELCRLSDRKEVQFLIEKLKSCSDDRASIILNEFFMNEQE